MQRKTSAGLWSSKGSRSTAKNGLIYGLRAKVEVRPTLAVGLAWGCPNPKRPGRGSSFIHHHVFVDLFFFFLLSRPPVFISVSFFSSSSGRFGLDRRVGWDSTLRSFVGFFVSFSVFFFGFLFIHFTRLDSISGKFDWV